MFSNVRLPDQRRKQLIAKLSGQTGGGAAPGVPMPGAVGAEGRPFHSIGNFHLPRPSVTQGSNVLSSVLARLGVSGHGTSDEVSPGAGMAIGQPSRPTPPFGGPSGSPIPVPGAPVPPPIPLAPQGGGPASPGGFPAGATPPPGYGDSISSVDPGTGMRSVNEGALPSLTGSLVPLGNGMYYDPQLDKVITAGDMNSAAGGATRRL